LQGKIAHGGNLHGNEEEGKKEETLTVCETILRTGQEINQPLRRSLLRGASFLEQLAIGSWPSQQPNLPAANCQLLAHKILHVDPAWVCHNCETTGFEPWVRT
jgi:hypothetical protein